MSTREHLYQLAEAAATAAWDDADEAAHAPRAVVDAVLPLITKPEQLAGVPELSLLVSNGGVIYEWSDGALTIDGAGVVQLISLESAWIEAGELPEAVRLLGRSWDDVDEEHRTEATQFVVRAAALLDPIQTDDIFEAIFESEQLLVDVGPSVAAALYSLLDGDGTSTFQKAVIAENLTRLSANGYFGPMRVTGLLLNQCSALGPRVQADHEAHEETGRRLVRALGLAAQYLGDGSGELESTLEELASAHEEIADDAAFELGQSQIRSAVSSTREDEARDRLTEAARWFGVAESGQEYRPDAALLGVSVRHINSFCAGGRIEAADVDQVRSLAWSFIEGGIEEEPSWRTQRTESMLAWGRLVSALEKCAGLDDAAWYDPPALIAALGEAIQVQRGIGWYYRSRGAASADDLDLYDPADILTDSPLTVVWMP